MRSKHISDEQIDAAVGAWFASAHKDGATFRTRMREAIVALRPAAQPAVPVGWQPVAEDDLTAFEKFIADRSQNAPFIPADAHTLANATMHMIREVRDTRARLSAAPAAQPVGDMPMPTNEDQAAAMQMLGQAWLEQHAPHRLKAAQPTGDVMALLDQIKGALGHPDNVAMVDRVVKLLTSAQPVGELVAISNHEKDCATCAHQTLPPYVPKCQQCNRLATGARRNWQPQTNYHPQPAPIVDEHGNAMVLAAHLAVETIAQMEQPQASWTVPVYVPADQAQKVLEAIRLERESDALHQAQVRAAVMRKHPQ